jgi:PAS domain S-box-containing protein
MESHSTLGKTPVKVYRDPEARCQAMLNNTLISFILVDKASHIIAFNPLAEKIFKEITGLKLAEGYNLQKILSQKEFTAFNIDLQNAFKGKTIASERSLQDKKKNTRAFRLNFTPIAADDGHAQCVSFSALEVTDFRKASEELDRSEKLIESVFHTADVGIAIIDRNERIIKMNDGLCKMFGYEKDELNGKYWYNVAAPDNKEATKAMHSEILNGKEISGENKVICKDGTVIDVYATNKLLKNSDGSVYIVKTLRDITESKQYKELLHRTESLARVGGFEVSPGGKEVVWTENLYNIFEVEKGFTPSLSWIYDAYLPQDRNEVKQRIHDALVHGKKFDVARQMLSHRNNLKWLHIVGTPVEIKANSYMLIGAIQDITVQKQAEEEIERLSWVASHTNSAVSITDSLGKIDWVNKSFEKLTGYTLDEVKGRTPGEVLQGNGTDKEAIKRISERLAKHEPSTGEVVLNFTKSGEPVWISADITPIFKDGKLINYIGIMTDLTEMMKGREIEKKQNALLHKQQLFNAIATYFPSGIICVIDRDLKYVFVGGTELKNFSMDHNSLIGEKIFDKLNPEPNDHAEPFLRKVFDGEDVSFEIVIASHSYHVTAVPIKDHDNGLSQALVVINNITEQKKTEEGLKKVIEKQKELNEMKTKFVSIASHEFRTPLSTILSSSSLVEKYNKPEDGPKREKHLARIKSSVHNLTDILNDFLILGKMEDGGVKNNPALFDIQLFFRELIDEMHGNLKEGQEIKLTEYHDRDIAYLDTKHFKNVLLNLLSNAIKYSPEGKAIYIDSTFKDGHLSVSVRDEGMGIPHDDQVHLFTTFYRANNVTNIQGTGMGLHIVKKYMDMMGGSVGFSSELDKGSVFTIEVPHALIQEPVAVE